MSALNCNLHNIESILLLVYDHFGLLESSLRGQLGLAEEGELCLAARVHLGLATCGSYGRARGQRSSFWIF